MNDITDNGASLVCDEIVEEVVDFTLIKLPTKNEGVVGFSEISRIISVPKIEHMVYGLWAVGKPSIMHALKCYVYHKTICFAGEWAKAVLIKLLIKVFFASISSPTMVLAMTGYVVYCMKDYILPMDVISASIEIYNKTIRVKSETVKLIGWHDQEKRSRLRSLWNAYAPRGFVLL